MNFEIERKPLIVLKKGSSDIELDTTIVCLLNEITQKRYRRIIVAFAAQQHVVALPELIVHQQYIAATAINRLVTTQNKPAAADKLMLYYLYMEMWLKYLY